MLDLSPDKLCEFLQKMFTSAVFAYHSHDALIAQ